ncbi:hypothetical protein CFK37_17990 [Virgibacillus phasianinus]|uniref:Uncharacterized protein n=1 Tax=Virgibacillus phasianinus TaxID=2017483 RepID=A0A220U7S4_9BACI|nr:hypothetical protein [Virgibacillus phasianinus]ASK63911.1 hypothetical protein CFK37_17990 [Virgibacillus phasianinus]
MEDFYKLVLGFFIVAVQYFLARRPNVYFGAILPVAFTIIMFGWVYNEVGDGEGFSFYTTLILGLAIFLGEWIQGREAIKDKRKKELEKMKSYDMK